MAAVPTAVCTVYFPNPDIDFAYPKDLLTNQFTFHPVRSIHPSLVTFKVLNGRIYNSVSDGYFVTTENRVAHENQAVSGTMFELSTEFLIGYISNYAKI